MLLELDYIRKNFDEKEINDLKTIVIAIHGFSSSKNSFVINQIAPILRKENIGILCFDLPGHGTRNKEKLNVQACLDSIIEIENKIRKIYKGKISFTGASFGGFLLLRYLQNNNREYGKVILRAPALEQYEIWKDDISENGRELIKSLESGNNYFQGKMEVETSVLNDYFKFDIFNNLNIEQDVVILYGSKDKTVSNQNIFKLAKMKNWELFEIEGADHFCRREKDIERIANLFINILK